MKLQNLIQRLPQGEYELLSPFLRYGLRENDPQFWAVSHGVRGLINRIRTAWIYLQIVQSLCDGGYVCRCGAICVWRKLVAQAFFSILALPEAALCHIWKLQRRAAKRAVQYYCEILIEANTLCVTPVLPECLLVLPELL